MNITENCFENEYASFWVQKGILFFVYKPRTVLDLYVARKVIADRVTFQHKKAYPILCDIRGIVDADKAARDYMARRGYVLAKAVSFLTYPSFSMSLIQYYLEIHEPDIPSRLFTEEDQGIAFLKPYT